MIEKDLRQEAYPQCESDELWKEKIQCDCELSGIEVSRCAICEV